MKTYSNNRQEVLSTVNAVLPSIMGNPEKYGISDSRLANYPTYGNEKIVSKAFEIAFKVQEELDKRTIE
ncbi:hypothetical protein [Siphonobacter sp. SORGH_AS_0500]|uniref:hypothetical protein n=1 Tax=Siphonobacter sp. SORGH_AS_0500 TaxID=1864824 RepID=UPI0028635CF9|nr:hypothetical protein [Siphonobacter sp. SORGH_AS_0500]MDR6195666.1 hypothetical protein [Siphonobacter sp. SORGH_AS_0500]